MSDSWIIDFGSQYTQLITRRSRELGYSSIILTIDEARERLKSEKPLAFILSGGPHSIFEDQEDYSFIFEEKLPVLGICYGMQLIGQFFKGKVERGVQGEYGFANVHVENQKCLGHLKESSFQVWMSHFDHLITPPEGFVVTLKSENGIIAGIENTSKKMMALQFHPEVEHTLQGRDILRHFFEDVAGLKKNWSNAKMISLCENEVSAVKESYVLCAFSGGVDSLVAATLASNVIGDKLYCFFVDNGLLRPQDYHHIEVLKSETNLQIEVIDAKELFLAKLAGVGEPEKKRKIIGNTFIEVFDQKVHDFEKSHNLKFEYLLQGTLYPDVIESVSPHQKGGKSVTIKSHHNVGGLPEKMNLKLLEPLKFLFKDEVREIGEELGLKHEWVHRHPFPGPGIGVRVLGELTAKAIKAVQESDDILFHELHAHKLYEACWQAFTVFLPVETVGVKGDARAYENVICLRIVNSTDGMTADWTRHPYEFLAKVSSRICNEVSGITRVVYDITSKPPGTIEWE